MDYFLFLYLYVLGLDLVYLCDWLFSICIICFLMLLLFFPELNAHFKGFRSLTLHKRCAVKVEQSN